MSHGYDYYGGAGQPLLYGYTKLLPAIVSALCPSTLWAAGMLDIPPCYDSDKYSIPVELNSMVHALRPNVPAEARREFISRKEAFFEPGTPPVEDAWCTMGIVASALGIDPTDLDPDGDCQGFNFQDVVASAEEGDEDSLGIASFASLLYWTASESHQLVNAGEDPEAIAFAYPWTQNWYPYQLAEAAQWPPNKDALRKYNQ